MPAAFTYDLETDVGKVRLLVSDTDSGAFVFSDTELDGFLVLEGEDVRLAAAQALETLASNEVLVSKKIRTQNLTTDGPAVAAELRARASALRSQAEAAAADADGSEGEWAIAEFADDPFAWRDRMLRQAVRGT